MKVYRLERDGRGPFTTGNSCKRSGSYKKAKRSSHVWHQVGGRSTQTAIINSRAVRAGYLFGTGSKELLKAYFGFNLAPYFKKGFRIKVYDIPSENVVHMGIELAFKPVDNR